MSGPTVPAATTPRSRPRSLVDPATLMRIKNLQVRAKVVVEGFYNGLHRSPFHGFSAEFSEYRQYTPGDDPRYLDWKLYARSDRYYIKRFEDETNRRCYLLVDLSRSMGYGSLAYSKADYARTMAATLAHYLALQKDSVGLLTFDETISEFIAARHRAGHLHQLMVCLERALGGTGTNLEKPLEQISALVTKRGLIVLISDLLADVGTLNTHLGYLRSRGHEVLVVRVLDPAEVSFPFEQASMFHDAETGRDLFIDPAVARRSYQQRFAAHDEKIRSLCASQGIDYTQLLTDQPLEVALYDLLSAQMRQGRTFRRRVGRRSQGGAA